MKHICKRDLARNLYQHVGDEPMVVTNQGNPDLFVGSISNIANLDATLNSLNAFKASIASTNQNMGVASGAIASYSQPILKGGQIVYEKTHTHKK